MSLELSIPNRYRVVLKGYMPYSDIEQKFGLFRLFMVLQIAKSRHEDGFFK